MAAVVPTKSKTKRRVRAQVQAKMRAKARTDKPKAAPGNVAELRRQLQLSQAAFAPLLPVSVRTLATLESGSSPTEAVARRLIELRRLTDALADVLKQESLGRWLQTPNPAFGSLKPLEVIDRGECDRLWAMIYFLRSGTPSS